MSKFEMTASKVYKPEILQCPKCGEKLTYKHAISNKTVQFSSGKHFKIVNLGYGCLNCNDGNIYFSQTATKLSFKGYTYSSKIICMIDYYKKKGYSRDEIVDLLDNKGVIISDRNVDNIYKKFQESLKDDYDSIIMEAYDRMIKEFNQIRISLDLITVCEIRYVILYDYFTGARLATWKIAIDDDEGLIATLKKYINENLNITTIVSIRNINRFLPLVKSLAPETTKFLAFAKF